MIDSTAATFGLAGTKITNKQQKKKANFNLNWFIWRCLWQNRNWVDWRMWIWLDNFTPYAKEWNHVRSSSKVQATDSDLGILILTCLQFCLVSAIQNFIKEGRISNLKSPVCGWNLSRGRGQMAADGRTIKIKCKLRRITVDAQGSRRSLICAKTVYLWLRSLRIFNPKSPRYFRQNRVLCWGF